MEIEAEKLVTMLERAERDGVCKTLMWLSSEFTEGMTAEDVKHVVNGVIGQVIADMSDDFCNQYFVSEHISNLVSKRK